MSESEIVQGEHIIAFWVEGNKTKWYLGIVETKKKKDKLVIPYMSKADKKEKVWTFPECAGKSCYKRCYKSCYKS